MIEHQAADQGNSGQSRQRHTAGRGPPGPEEQHQGQAQHTGCDEPSLLSGETHGSSWRSIPARGCGEGGGGPVGVTVADITAVHVFCSVAAFSDPVADP